MTQRATGEMPPQRGTSRFCNYNICYAATECCCRPFASDIDARAECAYASRSRSVINS